MGLLITELQNKIMEFKITRATYNCATEEIEVEYSGIPENIYIVNELKNELVSAYILKNKVVLSRGISEGGYRICKINKNGRLEVLNFFYKNCSGICKFTSPIKSDNYRRLRIDFDNGNSYCALSIEIDSINYCEPIKRVFTFQYFDKYLNKTSYSKTTGNTTGIFLFGCTPEFQFKDLMYSPYEIWVNTYDCNNCLIETFYKKIEIEDQSSHGIVSYDCNIGLNYILNQNLDVTINEKEFPYQTPYFLKNGKYIIRATPKCNEQLCNFLPFYQVLKVNCMEKFNRVNETFCIEDANSIIKIDKLDGCILRITNSINKIIKIRRVLLDSHNRSCSGNPLSVFDYTELLPLQYVDINNEGFGYDSRLEIEYKTGDIVCENQICLPYCDLSVIGDRSDLKSLVFKKGISGDDSVLTVFNPLGNGIVSFILIINGEEIIENIVDGTQVAIKVDGNVRGAKYKFSSVKNNDIIKSGTVDLTKTSEIPNGILYTDLETVNGVEYFTIKMT